MRIDALLASPVLTARSDAFARAVRFFAEACIMVNQDYLREIGAPSLYASGVEYRMSYDNPTELVDIPIIIKRGYAYCLSLSCWRVAELRNSGDDRNAAIAIRWKTVDVDGHKKRLFHVLVRRGNGTLEDPSKILGM